MSFDHTAFNVHLDPLTNYISGRAIHGNMLFECPYMSEITPTLWQGGCTSGMVLPTNIEHIVSLYKWEQYTINHEVKSSLTVEMYDSSDEVDYDKVIEIAEHVRKCMHDGVTLSQCQAGLNRSALIAGTALVLDGMDPRETIALLRSKRSPAVLCNRTFEKFILNLK